MLTTTSTPSYNYYLKMTTGEHKHCSRMLMVLNKVVKKMQKRFYSKKLIGTKNMSKNLKCLDKMSENNKQNVMSEENIYISVPQKNSDPVFKMDRSECPSCIFGDPSFTCTCNFRSRSPDFKLYEDEEQFIQIYSSDN